MTKARKVEVAAFGAPDVMKLVTVDLPPPGAGEAQIRQTAIGFNYLDISLDAPRIMPTPRARTMSRAGAPPSLPDATVPSDNDVRHFCRALVRVPDVRKVVVRRSGYATARSTVEATCALTEGVRQWMSLVSFIDDYCSCLGCD